ncbi:MAG: PqqD family protein [Myxococcota bacterium]
MANAKRYKQHPDVVCRRVATEIFLVPIRQNVREVGLFTLNEVGAFIWDRLDGKHTTDDLVREVVAAFDVGVEKATEDVETFMAKLSKVGGVHEA